MSSNLSTSLFRILTFIFFLLPGGGLTAESVMEQAGDVIVTIEGKVRAIGFADLNGDLLDDLIVVASPGPVGGEHASLQIFVQTPKGRFLPLPLSGDWFEKISLVDVGNYAVSPGEEVLVVDGVSVKVLGIDRQGNARLAAKPVLLETLFHAPAHRFPHLLNCSIDLNADGCDDAMIPTPKGYALLLSRGDGSFSKPIYLPSVPEWSIQFSDNTLFSLMSLTGKLQPIQQFGRFPLLVSEIGGKIVGWKLNPEGDGLLKMESEGSDFGSYSSVVKEGTIEYSGIVFSSVKGRRFPLMVRSHRQGRTGILAELKTTHTVYSFSADEASNKLVLTPKQKIATDGIAAAPFFADLNVDGHRDLIFLYVKTSVLTKVLEMLLDRVVITCQAHLYQQGEERYSFGPDWSEEFSVPAKSFRTVGVEGLLQFNGDYNGDRRPDLVVYASDRLLIKRGSEEKGFFSNQEISFKRRHFYQIGEPFPGPIISRNLDADACPEIITYGDNMVRIVHVR